MADGNQKKGKSSSLVGNTGVFGTIKKVFNKVSTTKVGKQNLALREILNKTLANQSKTEKIVQPPAEISLDALRDKKSASSIPTRRLAGGVAAAGSGGKHKLKDLILEKIEKEKEETIPIPPSNPVPKNPQPETGQPKTEKVKEVPEDVLRKILE